LIATYWRPVFSYLRAKGHTATDAEDLTQEFFVRFLAKGWLDRADPGKGCFRAFLKTLAGRFALVRTDRARQQDRFERQFVAVSTLVKDEDRRYEPAAGETPEEAFDRQWKQETLATVRRNLRAYYEGADDPKLRRRFEIFAAYYLAERVSEQPTRDVLAARYGMTLDAVRHALDEVNKRYERLLRQEIRDQVGSEDEVEAELRSLV
jgi:RNA polymerase sigma-70 factor (ECF subfamily)